MFDDVCCAGFPDTDQLKAMEKSLALQVAAKL